MRRSCLVQIALLFALHLVGTVDGDNGKGSSSDASAACAKVQFKTCSDSQQPKISQRAVKGPNNRINVRRVCYLTLPYFLTLNNDTAYMCTHLIAGFVKTLENGTLTMVRKSDPDQYRALLNLRSCNPNLKVLVTTGINNYNNQTGSTNFSVLVNSTTGRQTVIAAINPDMGAKVETLKQKQHFLFPKVASLITKDHKIY